ncbi:MAG: GTPase Era [Gammaproteobacteria bacterium RIFCSPLOWO2_02_FULL_42_14]|nr:MAG: GTPase Era [Gammaproteobacteria bacterium RIFCSPHIGHO2_02_FULL_42_43]OGT52398.1 MAG: GTPase Era [Gammaproteobacteria bacterium RIFCSPHIGHO2_12_FULL_41_25]OGT62474.1 MAG: GTPase Era [Gammaproteobacteria bacterium RIFCSPLOWO2_02_FULL_42_14]OGT86278.1 MAG: GTPase Era [Gammaproteobacteria bacterium RIFCSPLOWO2_12_FULL_42_18]
MTIKSGYIAIIGKPNVGKSTLMNYLLGKKISIVSRKPQTTRHRILGIKTTDTTQMVFVDTPGLHGNQTREANRVMNRVARMALFEVDIILFLIEPLRWDADDDLVLQQLKRIEKPVILVINKIDTVKHKEILLPFMENLAKQFMFEKIIPIAAKTGLQVGELESIIEKLLPQEGNLFPPEQWTDRSNQFIASEFVREPLMKLLGDEIPYELSVVTETFTEEKKLIRICAVIYVPKPSQKSIVIGKGGSVLKKVGTEARFNLEAYFEKKVFLKLWVKVGAVRVETR